MKTLQILDQESMDQIKSESLEFAKRKISTNPEENFETIYDQQREILTMIISHSQERRRMMEQAKKREEIIETLKMKIK